MLSNYKCEKERKDTVYFWLFNLLYQNKCSRKNWPLFRWKWLRPFWWISFCQLVQFLKPFELLMPSRFPQSFALLFILRMSLPALPPLACPSRLRGVAYSTCLLIGRQSAHQPIYFFFCFVFLLALSFWFSLSRSSPPARTSWLRLSGSSRYSLTDNCFCSRQTLPRFSPVQQRLSSPCGYLAFDKKFFVIFF